MFMISKMRNKRAFGIVNSINHRYLSKSELIDITTGSDMSLNEFLRMMNVISKICFKFKCFNDRSIVSNDEARIRNLMNFLKKVGILDDKAEYR